MITIDEFKRLDIRVAKIVEVQDHPKADRLLILKLDVGGQTKQTTAGIKGHYEKDDLMGRQVAIVNNLEPAMMRGIESQCMILAAQDEGSISILMPDREVAPGSRIF